MTMDWYFELFSRQAQPYTTLFIPQERVDIAYDDQPLQPGASYCKLWLSEMRLARDIEWGATRYPVVHAATSFFYAQDRVTIPCVADIDFLQGLTKRNRDRIIAYNYELTPLFPYKKHTVTVRAGLFSLVDSSILKQCVKALGQLSTLLPSVGELSTLLKLAQPLGDGMRDLLNIEDKALELGYIQTFSQAGSGGSNTLRPGYFVAIRAPEGKIEREKLCIICDQLHLGTAGTQREFMRNNTPFVDYSYMLFRIEGRRERDWDELSEIDTLLLNAQEALINGKSSELHAYLLPALKIAIMRSPDIARDDRSVMIKKILYTLQHSGLESTASEVTTHSLYAIMQQPLPPPDPDLDAELAQLQTLFDK